MPHRGQEGGVGLARTRPVIVAAALVALLALGALAGPASAASKAPNFSLVDVDGEAFNLTDYRGKVVLIDFMALTCDPCKVLAHDMKTLQDKHIKDLTILSVDIQPSFDRVSDLRAYASSNNYTWRFAMDTDDGQAFRAYSVSEIPKVIIVDREGYVTYEDKGAVGYDALKENVDAALAGEAEPIDLVKIGLLGMAFIAGITCFFSPCAFPLLPGYITFYFQQRASLSKRKEEEAAAAGRAAPVGASTGRSALTGLKLGSFSGGGIVLVYFVIGIIVIGLAAISIRVSGTTISYMKPIVGIILLLMGVLTVLDVPINTGYITAPFSRLKERIRPSKGVQQVSFSPSGLFLYGVAYGSASASCSVPVFIALVATSVSTGSLMDALVTFVVFLFSLWLLMAVMTAVLSVSEERVRRGLMKHYAAIKKVTGAVFLVAGGYLLWLYLHGEGYI